MHIVKLLKMDSDFNRFRLPRTTLDEKTGIITVHVELRKKTVAESARTAVKPRLDMTGSRNVFLISYPSWDPPSASATPCVASNVRGGQDYCGEGLSG